MARKKPNKKEKWQAQAEREHEEQRLEREHEAFGVPPGGGIVRSKAGGGYRVIRAKANSDEEDED